MPTTTDTTPTATSTPFHGVQIFHRDKIASSIGIPDAILFGTPPSPGPTNPP